MNHLRIRSTPIDGDSRSLCGNFHSGDGLCDYLDEVDCVDCRDDAGGNITATEMTALCNGPIVEMIPDAFDAIAAETRARLDANARAAMQGMLASGEIHYESIAMAAYKVALAMEDARKEAVK